MPERGLQHSVRPAVAMTGVFIKDQPQMPPDLDHLGA
jgi:hypothetical protein